MVDKQIKYTISRRRVRYPRLEFKTGNLIVIAPFGFEIPALIEKHRNWVLNKTEFINNTLKEKQIKDNFLSFGIHEYIEIPDMDYIRKVGIMGLEACDVFARAGKRVKEKKIKKGKTNKQKVYSEEIQEFMINKFNSY